MWGSASLYLPLEPHIYSFHTITHLYLVGRIMVVGHIPIIHTLLNVHQSHRHDGTHPSLLMSWQHSGEVAFSHVSVQWWAAQWGMTSPVCLPTQPCYLTKESSRPQNDLQCNASSPYDLTTHPFPPSMGKTNHPQGQGYTWSAMHLVQDLAMLASSGWNCSKNEHLQIYL